MNNPDYTICNEVGQRILRNALMNLITGRQEYTRAALQQVEALFDPATWPDWIDQAHLRFGHPADLRTGMLSKDIAVAYDWLYPSLSQAERDAILEGLSRRGIKPFFTSLGQDPWWTHDMNNWLTVIVGGLGIAGMALGRDHPDAGKLVHHAIPLMQQYLTIYGEQGEFNESVAYANATKYPVAFFLAHHYWTGGGENRAGAQPFPETGIWTMYCTLPPGRVAAFGDARVDHPVDVSHIAAIAAAARHPVLQWFYLHYAGQTADPMELVWYDDTVAPQDPAGILPLGRAFTAHGANFSSRTDWNPVSTTCVVYGKAGREENHEHNDIGQVCIDGYGERLIVDLGSPSSYPPDFFDENRWKYYNSSVIGHNVLMIGGKEMKVVFRKRGDPISAAFRAMNAKILLAEFNDAVGCRWMINATGAYEDATLVRRAVIHLRPGIVAVLDEAILPVPEEVSIRWHTADRAEPDAAGLFIVRGREAILSGLVLEPGKATMTIRRKEHRYIPPFDHDRLGEPLESRRESYIEATARGDSIRFLTLFSVSRAKEPVWSWQRSQEGAAIRTEDGTVTVAVSRKNLEVQNTGTRTSLSIDLQTASPH